MTDKTEAQPEALRLANNRPQSIDDDLYAWSLSAEYAIREQHVEIDRLRALAATCYAGLGGECDLPVIWLEALSDAANGEPFDTEGLLPYTSAIRAQLVAQTNRAAAAEQQVTALTQRLDMANRLNTDARDQLAQLSARQAAPDGQWKCGNEYLPYHPGASHVDPAYRDGWNDCYRAAPPAHEREPRTDEWHHNSRVESAAGIRDALSRTGVNLTITTILQLVDITRKAHGIGATND